MEHCSNNCVVSLESETQRKATLFRNQNSLAWTLLTSPRFCSSITNRRLRELECGCLPASITTRHPMGKGRNFQEQLFSPEFSICLNQLSRPMGLFHSCWTTGRHCALRHGDKDAEDGTAQATTQEVLYCSSLLSK